MVVRAATPSSDSKTSCRPAAVVPRQCQAVPGSVLHWPCDAGVLPRCAGNRFSEGGSELMSLKGRILVDYELF